MSQSELNNIHQRYLNDNIFTKKILLEILELLKKQEDNMSSILRTRSYNGIRNLRTNRLFNNLNSNSRNTNTNTENSSNNNSNNSNNNTSNSTSFRLNNISDLFDITTGLSNISNITIHRVHTNTENIPDTSQSPTLLTTEQINDILEDILFSDIQDDITRYSTCPITQTTFRPLTEVSRIKDCGHYFQKNAIRNWFHYNSTCPVCRKNLIPTTSDSIESTRYIPSLIESNINSQLQESNSENNINLEI